jgi:hypothetical protein
MGINMIKNRTQKIPFSAYEPRRIFPLCSLASLAAKFGSVAAMVRQKKAHICLPRQCVLFSTKFAFGE